MIPRTKTNGMFAKIPWSIIDIDSAVKKKFGRSYHFRIMIYNGYTLSRTIEKSDSV